MTPLWQTLLANVATIAILVGLWQLITGGFDRLTSNFNKIAAGLYWTACSVILMQTAFELNENLIFDLHSAPIGIAALFGGPVTGITAAVLAFGYDWALRTIPFEQAVISIFSVCVIGLIFHRLLNPHAISWRECAIFSIAVGLQDICRVLLVPADFWPDDSLTLLVVYGLIATLGTFVITTSISEIRRYRHIAEENKLYRTVVDALPDSLTVKDLNGVYSLANPASERLVAGQISEDIIGKSVADFFTNDIARQFQAVDQEVAGSGKSDVREEWIEYKSQAKRLVMSQRTPLIDENGHVTGLISHSRDITNLRSLETELEKSRKLFSDAIAHMIEGLALFDANKRLVICNEQYLSFFPKTRDKRKPGAHLDDIIRWSMEAGENVRVQNIDEDDRFTSLVANDRCEMLLSTGVWLEVHHRPIPNGHFLLIFRDITEAKHAQNQLLKLNEELAAQAAIDGLTGISNRAAFDKRIDEEWRRAKRNNTALSLLLIDIDYFKLYNDTYGHLAGDSCLKTVGRALDDTLQRGGDMMARFGGEEFVAILPDTDLKGAGELAIKLRKKIGSLNVVHEGSPHKVLSVSIGAASTDGTLNMQHPDELIAAADRALYDAKSSGRNLVKLAHPNTALVPDTPYGARMREDEDQAVAWSLAENG